MSDVIKALAEADPATDKQIELDPTSSKAQAMLSRALVEEQPARRRKLIRFRPPQLSRVMWAGGGTVVAATCAAVFLFGGGNGGTSPANASMLSAAQELPKKANEGKIVIDMQSANDANGSIINNSHQELRFKGKESQVEGSYKITRAGKLIEIDSSSTRIVNRRLYFKDHGDISWRQLKDDLVDEEVLARGKSMARVGDRKVAVSLVKALTNIHLTGENDGKKVYEGWISPEALQKSYGATDPYHVEAMSAHFEQNLDGALRVRGTVGVDGQLDKLAISTRTPWKSPGGKLELKSVTTTLTIDLSGLGTPQEITAPISSQTTDY